MNELTWQELLAIITVALLVGAIGEAIVIEQRNKRKEERENDNS